tara:strand:+ start:1529 stop:2602 length:1074 start_codon:yes stop_codon:yes gene_type:complete
MINYIFIKIKKFFRPTILKLNNFHIFMNFLFDRKIINLRSTRNSIKFNIINLKNFKKLLDKEETAKECTIDGKNIESEKELIEKSSKILKRYGVVIIKEAFEKKCIKEFVDGIEYISPKQKYYNNKKDNYEYEMSNELIPLHKNKFLLDNKIIKTIELSCNFDNYGNEEKIYARQLSKIIFFNTKKENTKNNWTGGWHVDFPTQFTSHIILDDLGEDKTRMQVLPGSNLLPLIPGNHYKIDELNFDSQKNILNCYGPKGTLYIHSGNTLHRNFPVLNTYRYVWSQIYTLDNIFVAADDEEKKSIFSQSQNYFNSLSDYNKEKIYPLINSPKDFLKNQIFKYDGKKYIKLSKNSMTYL